MIIIIIVINSNSNSNDSNHSNRNSNNCRDPKSYPHAQIPAARLRPVRLLRVWISGGLTQADS